MPNYLWKDYRMAVEAIDRAISCNPKRAELYADASQYLAADEQWDKAVLQLERAIQLKPEESGYKLALANIYMDHEVWEDAEGIINGVLSQEPSDQTARQFMAIIIQGKAEARFPEIDALLQNNKKREARKILKEVHQQFEEAQKLAKDDPDFLELLDSEFYSCKASIRSKFLSPYIRSNN